MRWILLLTMACAPQGGGAVVSTGSGTVAGTPAGAPTGTPTGTTTGVGTSTAEVLPVELVDIDHYEHLMEDRLFTHLGDDRGFGPEHDLARANIVEELESYGLTVVLEPFQYQGETYSNVVAVQQGTDVGSGMLVLGAHFDSVDNPGADDNATGTALVLETARVLSQFELGTTLAYVLFDREEQGLRGSAAFVQAHGSEVIAAVTADMIGQDHGGNAVDLFSTAPSVGWVQEFGAGIGTYGGGLGANVRTGNGFGFSDHASFEDAGIDAFVIIEADYGDNPHYHTQQDASDYSAGYVDYPYVERTVRAVVGFLSDQAGVVL